MVRRSRNKINFNNNSKNLINKIINNILQKMIIKKKKTKLFEISQTTVVQTTYLKIINNKIQNKEPN